MKFSGALMRMVAAGLLMVLAGLVCAQESYPSKPIRIVSPYPAGGSTSIMARLVAQPLTEAWGQQVIVDNRGGGNTLIGSEHVARSAADGYTLILVTTTHTIIPQLISTPYDPVKDFVPVATIGGTENILVVHPAVPVKNLKELIALAKAKPGQLNYGTSGSGSVTHLAIELFRIMSGTNMQAIPYKGSGPALTDLLGGQIQVYMNSAANFIPHIKSGRVKALAVSGEKRLAVVPELPTFSEAGLAGYNVRSWYGILAPAGAPKAIIDKLSREIARILTTPELKERLAGQGTEPFINTPEQFGELMKVDRAKYGKVIKAANIKLD